MKRNKVYGRTKQCRGLVQQMAAVDVAAVKGYWSGLSIDQKLRILHFDDPVIANRAFAVHRKLTAADMKCFNLGIRGQDAVREKVGMDQFVMECDPSDMRPLSFSAKQEFVEREDFFQYIGNTLGGSFIMAKQGVTRTEWSGVLEPTVSSWQTFMIQILTIVEYAILEAFNDAASNNIEACNDTLAEVDTAQETVEIAAGQPSASAKRRARKKRANQLVAERSLNPAERAGSSAEVIIESGTIHTVPEDTRVDHSLVDVHSDFNRTIEDESCLRFDWSVEGPPVDGCEEPAVELQVDWSVDGSHTTKRWSAWLPNGLNGSAAEWHWVADEPRVRAFIKNTFVETDAMLEESRARVRSLPARRRPAEL